MKIKILVALCKREGRFYIYDRVNDEGKVTEQWLGTGAAAYPIYGLPYITEESIVPLFDITEKQRMKMTFRRQNLPESFNFDHTDPDETEVARESLTLDYNGRIVRPVLTLNGIEFIDNEYYAPLSDIYGLSLYERHSQNEGIYFAVKEGLMIVGVILPLAIIEETLVSSMERLAQQCRRALTRKRHRTQEAEQRAEAQEGQAQGELFEGEGTDDTEADI